jgi:hypothetical protein
MSERLRRIQLVLVTASIAIPAIAASLMLVARWPNYWLWIASEQTPMTTLQVTVMYTTGLAFLATGIVHWVTSGHSRRSLCWQSLGVAFVYLACDDRFAIHERIRDNFLAPHGIRIPFLPIAPGDFILLLYALAGMGFVWRFRLILLENRAVFRWFIAGAVIAACAVCMDAYDIRSVGIDGERLEQTVEEFFELAAQICFLNAAWAAIMSIWLDRQ